MFFATYALKTVWKLYYITQLNLSNGPENQVIVIPFTHEERET